MAKQHFYSRVPAKVSMYNRSDGFDTFAHSEGLDRAFIEGELSAVYENKLSKNDMEAVRKGQMPLVYSQCCLRSGSLVQACIRYLPRDYTGERSAYLCHTLILTDEEREQLLYSTNNALFNPQMFAADTVPFDFTSPEAAPNDRYPHKSYIPIPVSDTKELVQKYNSDTLKNFLFALLCVFCAKGKTVYFKLPYDDAELSARALKFICSVATVIPYHMRKNLSFVTYITDPAQYANIKLKCVAANTPEIPASKGVFCDFHTGLVTGLPGVDVIAKAPVGFFYSLLEDAVIRNKFLQFMDQAVKTMPNLERLNMKTLSDLVFLFGGASGLFSEQVILPTDAKVYDFLCIYEKYRSAMSEEYRQNAYKCLKRYPLRHEAIPKNIFTKLSRLYPAEIASAKRIAMNTVLELIHTDIMRDKLFTFIKNNYDGEDADIRAAINADLCRVFYGGFLQPQIMSFFSEYFAQEPEDTQNAIFEKLMLTIRTEAVQPKILEFLGENYTNLSAQQKQYFYTTFFEMLPECDRLTASLIRLVNRQIEGESEETKEQVRERLAQLLEADNKRKEHRLMPMLCDAWGFCYDAVIRLVFGQWNTRKIFSEYLAHLSEKPVVPKTEEVFHIVDAVSENYETAQEKLLLALEQLYSHEAEGTNLYDWLEADRMAERKLSQGKNAFAYFFRVKVTQPAITSSLFDVFNTKLRCDGIEVIAEYVKNNTYLKDTQQFKTITTLLQLSKAAEMKDGKTVFLCLESLPKEEAVRKNIAGYIRTCLLDTATQNTEQTMLYEMCINALKNGVLLSETTYTSCKAYYIQQLSETQGAKGNAVKTAREGACCAADLILKYLTAACQTGAVLTRTICADTEGLETFLLGFVNDYGKGANKWILSHLTEPPAELEEAIRELLDGIKPQAGNLWTRIFGKK